LNPASSISLVGGHELGPGPRAVELSRPTSATIGALFKVLLRLEDGEPNDPAVLVTAVPNWTVGETFSTGRGHEWRILAINTNIAEELVDQSINAVFTVEPVKRLSRCDLGGS
jgi:hypothetical protein